MCFSRIKIFGILKYFLLYKYFKCTDSGCVFCASVLTLWVTEGRSRPNTTRQAGSDKGGTRLDHITWLTLVGHLTTDVGIPCISYYCVGYMWRSSTAYVSGTEMCINLE